MERARALAACSVIVAVTASCDDTGATSPAPLDGGPPACIAGEAALDDGTCQPAGVPASGCADGFVHDGDFGCTPVLPPARCPHGELAVPGDDACRPVAPCGSSKWGDAPIDAATQHVDGAYPGADSDGSEARPWRTIQDAIAAAPASGLVAIAAGMYAEDLVLAGKPARLWGRCPSMAQIQGTGAEYAALFLQGGSDGSEVRALGFTGAPRGIALSATNGIVLDRVWVHDVPDRGIDAESAFGPASFELRDSLVEVTGDSGILVASVDAMLEGVAVRATRLQPPTAGVYSGAGVAIGSDPSSPTSNRVTLRRALVEDAEQFGVYVVGSEVDVEGVVVRDVVPDPAGEFGRGISIRSGADGQRASVHLRGSVIERVREAGVFVAGSDATIENLVVRDVDTAPDGRFGRGMSFRDADDAAERAIGFVRASLVERCREVGIAVEGSDVTMESTRVRDMAPDALGLFGRGAHVQLDLATEAAASLVARACVLERSLDVGAMAVGAHLEILGTLVDTTAARAADGLYGDGIVVVEGTAVVEASRAASSARAGLSMYGGVVSIGGSVLECNPIHIDKEPGLMPAQLDDLGDNRCGCGDEQLACATVSAGLVPPEPIEP